MKRLLLFILLQIIPTRVLATMFTVTSNADSGVGSLRAALMGAAGNGSLTTDSIYFNIPDQTEAGRTITLLSNLPSVSSNLVIDGTTQPGNKLGVSDAKIKLTLDPNVNVASNADHAIMQLLNMSRVNNINIYGLWLAGNFQQATSGTRDGISATGINISGGTNITIGAPGKGNLINNCFYGINISPTSPPSPPVISSDIAIQANIIGLNSDGISPFKNYTAIEGLQVNNLTVGGTQQNEGNVLTNYGQNEIELSACTNTIITHNLLGTDITGNATVGSTFIGTKLYSSGIIFDRGDNLTVSDNVLSGLGEAIILTNIISAYTVANNKFGLGLSNNNANLGDREAVVIADCTAPGTIFNNTFFYNDEALDIYGSGPVTITKNIFDCNIKPDNIFYGNLSKIPTITVDSKSSSQVSGTATANSTVELFYVGSCGCQAKTYITTVQANNSGNWTYAAGLSPTAILATATNQVGGTSPFSLPIVIEGNVIVKNASCGNNGSITGILFNNATDAYWTDLTTGSITKQNDIKDLAAGKYVFTISNGVCSTTSKVYEVRDDKINVDASKAITADALCGLPTGGVTGIMVTTTAPYYTAAWRSESGEVVSVKLDLGSVKAGKYTLTITPPGEECSQILPFTIGNSSLTIAAPSIGNMLLCNPGDATIAVNNPSADFSYRLYDDELSAIPIDDETSGKFKVNVKSNRSYYITQHKGDCESSRVEVKVIVLNTALNIANTFTPNGDGINDTWTIGGIENFPGASVQLYTRSGEKVFETEKYTTPFNGLYKGKLLPIGTYYYIINLKIPGSQCGLVSGSLTIVR